MFFFKDQHNCTRGAASMSSQKKARGLPGMKEGSLVQMLHRQGVQQAAADEAKKLVDAAALAAERLVDATKEADETATAAAAVCRHQRPIAFRGLSTSTTYRFSMSSILRVCPSLKNLRSTILECKRSEVCLKSTGRTSRKVVIAILRCFQTQLCPSMRCTRSWCGSVAGEGGGKV